ncbi:MAG TPA: glycosyltransferase family 9 protein [Pirellulales bacterium]|jgi:ADP-heptose:LPS heptosyltransferase|nr:glycosyltransferase family 9 protein [Pirellulales bacterium]
MESFKRILLVRNDRIGDLVLTLPALEAVRAAWPQAHVAVLASAYAGSLLSGCRCIDELLVDDRSEGARKLGRRLAAMQFDAALVFNTNTRNCLAVWQAGIRRRVFWCYKPVGFLLGNTRVAIHRNRPPIHEAEFALAFVRRLGVDVSLADLSPRLEIDPATQRRVAARLRADLGAGGPLFGVHPGNDRSAYNWPPEHYSSLIRELSRHARVMVTGSPAERPLLERVRRQLDSAAKRRVVFYTDFQLLELAAAISEQTALTVSSTGPMHIAGIVGTPVVALFSPHPAHVPQKWSPLGQNHTLLVAPLGPRESPRLSHDEGTRLMARINVRQVLEANVKYAERDMRRRESPERAA